MNESYILMLYVLQIVSLYNAIILGWRVKKIGMNTYELSKNIDDNFDFNFQEFIDHIVSVSIIRV